MINSTKTIAVIAGLSLAIFGTWTISSCSQVSASNAESSVATSADVIPDLLMRTGKLSETEEWSKTIQVVGQVNEQLKKDPTDVKSKLRLSEIYMNEARITGEHGHYYPAVLTILDSVLDDEGLNEDSEFHALSLKSSVLLSLHKFSYAKALASSAVELRPHNAQIYGALVDANVELGNYEEAVAMATKMMDLRPDLLSYARASYLREIHGDTNGAIEAMDLAVSSGFPGNENTAWSRLNLGGLYEEVGKLSEAERQYQTALLERPDYPFAIAALAGIEAKKGNIEEAEKLYEEAIAIIPEVSFNAELAALYMESGRTEQANEMSQDVLEMLADDEAHGHMMDMEYAKVYLNLLHDYDAALTKALIEYKARPMNVDVNKLLAEIYYKKGDMVKAEEHLARAMRTGSTASDLLTIAGLIHTMNGKETVGKELLNSSREMNPYQKGQFAKEAQTIVGAS